MSMATIPDNGDNHIYIIASDNNDYRLRLPAACPPLARRLPAACTPLRSILYIYLWGNTPYLNK